MKTKLLFTALVLSALCTNISAEITMGETYFINDFSDPLNDPPVPEEFFGWFAHQDWSDDKLSIFVEDIGGDAGNPIYRMRNQSGLISLVIRECRKAELKLSITGFPDAPANFLNFRFGNTDWQYYSEAPDLLFRDGRTLTLTFNFPSGEGGTNGGFRWGKFMEFEIRPNDFSYWGTGTITLEYLKIGEYVIPPAEIETEKDTPINFDLAATVLKTTGDLSITNFVFSAEGLPEGVSINSSTGIISGTPDSEFTTTVTATITLKYNIEDDTYTVTQDIYFLPPREKTPEAQIDFANEKLKNLQSGASYLLNGTRRIADSEGKISIDECFFGWDLNIVKENDETPDRNSDPQILPIPARPDAPEVTGGAGSIDDTTTDMEYSNNGKNWKDCDDDTTAGLTEGTYYVRLKGTDTSFPSEVAEVIVALPLFIAELEWQAAPSLYPNPASDYVVIQNALGKPVSIYTCLGSKIFETAQLNNENISVSTLASGIYFVKVDKAVLKLIKR